MLIDRVTLFVKGGDGGNGCVSFRREKFVPKGGPDGGDGGRGGSVIVRATASADSLAGIMHRKHWRATNGQPGGSANCTGRSAEDLVIDVPAGTLVLDRDRGHTLKDLVAIGDQVTVGRGGKGGRGNKYFTTSTNQAPTEAEEGEAGEERWLVLELKMIADVGLIGLPNAGKSTLLSRLSRARPAIADYPFTTRYPNLGMVSIDDEHSFVLADIPGLIEGAHAGTGLGHEFLRHVERTGVLVHLVEPLPVDGSDPIQNYQTVRKELALYNPLLSDKPELVVVSKAELTDTGAVCQALNSVLHEPVLAISAVTGQGLAELVRLIARRLRETPK